MAHCSPTAAHTYIYSLSVIWIQEKQSPTNATVDAEMHSIFQGHFDGLG